MNTERLCVPELRLHKLKFVDLLARGNKMAAIAYARQNFPRFVGGQEREVQAGRAYNYNMQAMLRILIRYPVTFVGWVENQDPDPGLTSYVIFQRAKKQF